MSWSLVYRTRIDKGMLQLRASVRFFAAISMTLTAAYPEPARRVVAIQVGRLLDVKAGVVRREQLILVDQGRITAVGPRKRLKVPPHAKVIALGNAFALPGLIDAHTHLAWKPTDPSQQPSNEVVGADAARATLLAGFTTVRNLGSTGH